MQVGVDSDFDDPAIDAESALEEDTDTAAQDHSPSIPVWLEAYALDDFKISAKQSGTTSSPGSLEMMFELDPTDLVQARARPTDATYSLDGTGTFTLTNTNPGPLFVTLGKSPYPLIEWYWHRDDLGQYADLCGTGASSLSEEYCLALTAAFADPDAPYGGYKATLQPGETISAPLWTSDLALIRGRAVEEDQIDRYEEAVESVPPALFVVLTSGTIGFHLESPCIPTTSGDTPVGIFDMAGRELVGNADRSGGITNRGPLCRDLDITARALQ